MTLIITYRRLMATVLALGVVFPVLYWMSREHYLLFHTFVETFCAVIAFMIFAVVWNSRRTIDNTFFLYIGVTYLFVGILTILHLLAYKGMPVFVGFDADLPTQLWIATRGLQSLILLGAVLMIGRRVPLNWVMGGLIAGFVWLLLSIFYFRNFPQCYIEGVGLTAFKKGAEYVISGLMVATMIGLWRVRLRFDRGVYQTLMAAFAVSILAELCFTGYTRVYDVFNMLGHYTELVAFFLMYRAIIETSFFAPLDILYRNLKQQEQALKADIALRVQLENRQAQLITELRESLNNVKTLRGLLPICASCKKIRDDQGYWSQVETYIKKHTDADFSHSVCPECIKKLYPELIPPQIDI